MQAPPTRLVLLRGGQDQAISDADLARALIAGQPDANRLAWTRFAPYVRVSLRKMLGPGAEEEDLQQEVFIRFFRRVGGLREPAAVRSFLFAVCLRVARREVTRRWVRRWLRLTGDGIIPDRTGPTSDVEDPDVREAVTRYYRILDDVGGEARSLFVARHIEGLELQEVARLHNISVSTAQRRLARASKRVEAMVARDPMLTEMRR